MQNYVDIDNWNVLFVKTGEEENVKQRLIYRYGERIKILIPRRKLRERKQGKWYFISRIMFPGYVLVHGEIDNHFIGQIKGIPGIFKLLKSEATPLKVEWYEMEFLCKLICNGDEIGFSEVILENKKVRVVDGPLVSMEGSIVSVNQRKGRARVRFNLLGQERIVELGVNILRADDDPVYNT